jgi:hypothetical protein
MSDQFEKHRGFIESLPGPVKVLVVETTVAAAMIFVAGIPWEWVVGVTVVGDACAMFFRKRKPGETDDYWIQ